MARWQILKDNIPETDPENPQSSWFFDDTNPGGPGEKGFTTDVVADFCANLGQAYGFSYVGVSDFLMTPPQGEEA